MTLTKDLVVRLDQDYVQYSICFQAFTTDMESTGQTNSYKPQAAACLGFRADTIFARCGCTLVGPSGALDVQISVEQINLFLKIPIITEC